MKRECETCIKRKTLYCPSTNECMYTDDMPYYQNRVMLLEENKKLNGAIQTYDILLKANAEENKQLKDNWNKLKEWLEKELGDRINPNKDKWLTGIYDAYRETIDKMQELEQGSDSNAKD